MVLFPPASLVIHFCRTGWPSFFFSGIIALYCAIYRLCRGCKELKRSFCSGCCVLRSCSSEAAFSEVRSRCQGAVTNSASSTRACCYTLENTAKGEKLLQQTLRWYLWLCSGQERRSPEVKISEFIDVPATLELLHWNFGTMLAVGTTQHSNVTWHILSRKHSGNGKLDELRMRSLFQSSRIGPWPVADRATTKLKSVFNKCFQNTCAKRTGRGPEWQTFKGSGWNSWALRSTSTCHKLKWTLSVIWVLPVGLLPVTKEYFTPS